MSSSLIQFRKLLSAYYALLGTVLGLKDTVMNKTLKNSYPSYIFDGWVK